MFEWNENNEMSLIDVPTEQRQSLLPECSVKQSCYLGPSNETDLFKQTPSEVGGFSDTTCVLLPDSVISARNEYPTGFTPFTTEQVESPSLNDRFTLKSSFGNFGSQQNTKQANFSDNTFFDTPKLSLEKTGHVNSIDSSPFNVQSNNPLFSDNEEKISFFDEPLTLKLDTSSSLNLSSASKGSFSFFGDDDPSPFGGISSLSSDKQQTSNLTLESHTPLLADPSLTSGFTNEPEWPSAGAKELEYAAFSQELFADYANSLGNTEAAMTARLVGKLFSCAQKYLTEKDAGNESPFLSALADTVLETGLDKGIDFLLDKTMSMTNPLTTPIKIALKVGADLTEPTRQKFENSDGTFTDKVFLHNDVVDKHWDNDHLRTFHSELFENQAAMDTYSLVKTLQISDKAANDLTGNTAKFFREQSSHLFFKLKSRFDSQIEEKNTLLDSSIKQGGLHTKLSGL